MSIVGMALNLLLAGMLAAALAMGWRLNLRLKALRDSHDGFAIAVRELNTAAERAEQGLADLRAATDEATDQLADRIDKGRALAAKLERLIDQAPEAARKVTEPQDERAQERRLGALLAAAREARARPERLVRRDAPTASARLRPSFEDDLFDEAPPERAALSAIRGGRS
jgi:septal ring factor EnvC (AmiA/AmiB activator)